MLSNFVFNCKNYLQIRGCAIGTIRAPAYANIFMDHYERKYIYPYLEGLSLSYLRFIDDICGALRDLVPCAQFKKREKHPWRSVTFIKDTG